MSKGFRRFSLRFILQAGYIFLFELYDLGPLSWSGCVDDGRRCCTRRILEKRSAIVVSDPSPSIWLGAVSSQPVPVRVSYVSSKLLLIHLIPVAHEVEAARGGFPLWFLVYFFLLPEFVRANLQIGGNNSRRQRGRELAPSRARF